MTQWTNPWCSSYGTYKAMPGYQVPGKREPVLAGDDDDWETDSNFMNYGSERDSRCGPGRQNSQGKATSSFTSDLSRSTQESARYRPMDMRPEAQAQRGPHYNHCESKVNKVSGNQMYSACNKSTYADYAENAIERSSIFNFNTSAPVKLDQCTEEKLDTMSKASLQTEPPQVAVENDLYENAEALCEGKEPKPIVHQVPKPQQSISNYCAREAKPLAKSRQGGGQDCCIQLMASQFERNTPNSKARRETESGREKECEIQQKTWREAEKQSHWKYSTNKWNPMDGQSQNKGHRCPVNTKHPEEDKSLECSVYKNGAPCGCGYNQERENPTCPNTLQVMAPQVPCNRITHNLKTAKVLEDCNVKSCATCHGINHSLKMPVADALHESKGPQKDVVQETLTPENSGAPYSCRSSQRVDLSDTHHQDLGAVPQDQNFKSPGEKSGCMYCMGKTQYRQQKKEREQGSRTQHLQQKTEREPAMAALCLVDSGTAPQDQKFKNPEEKSDCIFCMQNTQHLQQRKEKHLQQKKEREQGRKATPKGIPRPYTTLKEVAAQLEAERRVQTMASLFERQANRDTEVTELENMHQAVQQQEREKNERTAGREHKERELKGREHKGSQQALF